jgi:hypothetical protein
MLANTDLSEATTTIALLPAKDFYISKDNWHGNHGSTELQMAFGICEYQSAYSLFEVGYQVAVLRMKMVGNF